MIVISIRPYGTDEMKLLSGRQMMLQHGDSVSDVTTVTCSPLFSEGDNGVVVSVGGDYWCWFGVEYQVETDPEQRTPGVNGSNILFWFQ